MQSDEVRQDSKRTAKDLLEVIEALMRDLHPHRAPRVQLQLDSSLDTDLGLDSLARVELISRLEEHFQVRLPQQVFADAASSRDLLRAIVSAQGRGTAVESLGRLELPGQPVAGLPRQAKTLVEVLRWHCTRSPGRPHLRIIDGERELGALTYAALQAGGKEVAAGLQRAGVQPGDCVALMLPTGEDYFHSFYGILMSGAIPVPIYPPVRRSRIGEHLQRQSGILGNCGAVLLITMPEAGNVARLLKSQLESLRGVVSVDKLRSGAGGYQAPAIGPHDIAFIQYTSGSTGSPKGVVLTHANLLANIRVMGQAAQAEPSDVFVSWLPLYHDMGLIGAWLGSLYHAMVLVVMSPLAFITRPHRWLNAIYRYRATMSASPNFGYELCLKQIADGDLEGLDLSTWRLAFNGAEQVSPDTIERFTRRFAAAGFRPEAMTPVYGLAESSVGLSFPPLGQPPRIDVIERETFSREGRALPAVHGSSDTLRWVSSGRPLPGHEIRIADEQDRELPERQEGALQFHGPSATAGYFRRPEETRALFHGDWLDSGDRAYVAEGDIFVTGRRKDIIIRGGRNLYPHELEEAIGDIPGIRKGSVAAFGASQPGTGTERLVILAETREYGEAARARLRTQAAAAVNDLIGLPPDEVVLARPHTVLKTSSGKIRRSACRDLYERGDVDRPQQPVWRQLAGAVRQSMRPTRRRMQRWLTSHLFAGYAWTVYGLLAVPTVLAVATIPGFERRWRTLSALARLLALATGTRIIVAGRDKLPPAVRPCLFVANHASYLDAYAVVAAVPRAFSFVAKSELAANRAIDALLRRMRVEYVERMETEQLIEDARRIASAAKQHRSLLFFPEGTFTRIPGLRDFHLGAFTTAAQANVPVVPIALRGTRSMLRSDSWFPRRGHITITIGEPIEPATPPAADDSAIWRSALELRTRAREHILRYCGEPDLSQE